MDTRESVLVWLYRRFYRVVPEVAGWERDPVWWVFPLLSGLGLGLLWFGDLLVTAAVMLSGDTCSEVDCARVDAAASLGFKLFGWALPVWWASWLLPIRRSVRPWRFVAAGLVLTLGLLAPLLVWVAAHGGE